MSDWLDDRAEEARAKDKQQQIAQQLELHKASVLQAKARGLLDALTAQVQKDFERYDEKFRGDPERQVSFSANPSGGFKLSKLHYPAAEMECTLNLPSRTIHADYRLRNSATAPPQNQTVDIALDVDANDSVTMSSANLRNIAHVEDASRLLIERLLFGS